jgi:biotin carboxyl carrier protein
MALLAAFGLTGCTRQDAPTEGAGVEPPTLVITRWTDKTELFMEYPPLVAGQSALYAVHLTRLSDFSAMTAGRPRVEFTPESGGTPIVLQGNPPSRPGVFRVEGASPPAGRYLWALVVEAADLSDRHDLGEVTVFGDEASAVADARQHAQEDPTAIAYLKEPQWTNGFATTPVREAEVRAAIRVPATVHPLPGGEAVVSAPAAGRLTAAALPSIGDRISAGQTLAWIEPRLSTGPDRATLAADVAEAQALLDAAGIEQARAERLLGERAVPARRVEDARRATAIAGHGCARPRPASRNATRRCSRVAARLRATALR